MHNPERGVSVLMRWFEPLRFLELIAEHRLQHASAVPSMIQLLLSAPLEDYDPFTPEETRDLLYRVLSTEQQKRLEIDRQIDFS